MLFRSFVYLAFPFCMEGMYATTFGYVSVKSHFGLFTTLTSFSQIRWRAISALLGCELSFPSISAWIGPAISVTLHPVGQSWLP